MRKIKILSLVLIILIAFAGGGYFYWKTRYLGGNDIITINKGKISALTEIAKYMLRDSSEEKVFLVLFQNNLELRPGGGFIGSFGIVKVRDRKISDFEVHDTGNFDGRIPNTVEPPFPMKDTLRIDSWKFRDSNYSPDLTENAKWAEKFYYMGGGQEKFNGVIAITADVLSSVLEITGSVEVPGYPGTYESESAVISLEEQVEIKYQEQGIKSGERKSVMSDLAAAILGKLYDLNNSQKIGMAKVIIRDLDNKNIQLNFKDEKVQRVVEEAGWAGEVDLEWTKDYLMAVDANLGAYKSDYYIERSMNYEVDLTKEKPEAILRITYKHNGLKKDWRTTNYLSYLRVYVPGDSWFLDSKNIDEEIQFGSELGKKYFGSLIYVPLNSEKTIEFRYTLPKELSSEYNLKIQKQSGVNDIPVSVKVRRENDEKNYEFLMNSDIVLE